MIDIDLSNLPAVTNDKFYSFYFDRSRYLVLMGGGGSGKSKFSAQKLVYRMIAEKGHRFMVVRKVADTLRDSVFADIKKVIYEWGFGDLFHIPEGRNSELYIKCKLNNNEILFYGLDKVEKRKSIEGITNIWIEEASELLVDDYRQLDIRMRGQSTYNQMIISFNPIDINHWLKKEFFDSAKPDVVTSHSSYKDNPFLDEGTRKTLEAFKYTDPYYYTVYCLGEWGVLGKTIFNAQQVTERISYLRASNRNVARGFFEYKKDTTDRIIDSSIRWVTETNGYISIYEEPASRIPYVIGGDTAGDGSDNFTGQVINNLTGQQVAVFKNQFDEDLYAEQMYCLGKHYNNALQSIETNFSTYPVKVLTRLGYSNQYVREREDTYTGGITKAYGFRTDKLSRPSALAELIKMARDNIDKINDIDTLNEMLTFVRNEKGRPQAQEGAHDDLIIALAIAYYSRGQQDSRMFEQIVEQKPTPFPFQSHSDDGGGYVDYS